jgi:hypothetical protein
MVKVPTPWRGVPRRRDGMTAAAVSAAAEVPDGAFMPPCEAHRCSEGQLGGAGFITPPSA